MPYRPLTSRGSLGASPSRAEIEHDVEQIARGSRERASDTPRGVSRDRDLATLRSLLVGQVHPTASGAEESGAKREVLRDLNQKYGTDVAEPWQMLALLRRGAEQLAAAGRRSSERFQILVSDHDRLRRAPDSLD